MAIQAPLTLVARVSAVEEAREREMLRLAEESIRRGHPEQAAIVYRKAAVRYRRDGLAPKELAVLNMWTRVAPHDPDAWTALADHHEVLEHRRGALEALARAAALWRSVGKDELAVPLEARFQGLQAGPVAPSVSQDVSVAPSIASEPEPLHASVAPPPAIEVAEEDDGPLELEIPETGSHDALDIALSSPAGTQEEVPERLPTGALGAIDDEPEALSAGALQVVEETGAHRLFQDVGGLPTYESQTEDHQTAPGQTYDRTVAGLMAADLEVDTDSGFGTGSHRSTEDEISPELMAELTAMADDDDDETGEEGAATIAMPALTPAMRAKMGLVDASTVMEESPQISDDYGAPDTRTRGYSADELKELDRLLKDRGHR